MQFSSLVCWCNWVVFGHLHHLCVSVRSSYFLFRSVPRLRNTEFGEESYCFAGIAASLLRSVSSNCDLANSSQELVKQRIKNSKKYNKDSPLTKKALEAVAAVQDLGNTNPRNPRHCDSIEGCSRRAFSRLLLAFQGFSAREKKTSGIISVPRG